MTRRGAVILALAVLLTSAGLGKTQAAEVPFAKVAVAANFVAPMEKLAEQFYRQYQTKLLLSTGATGQFYAQIKNGAPFELFFAADQVTPSRLVKEGFALAPSQKTYALGKLALWSRQEGLIDAQGQYLKTGSFRKIALADPALAPYGKAALDILNQLGLHENLRRKLVMGENIAQTFHFVDTGNAEVGFVALSQIFLEQRLTKGSVWIVPQSMYPEIRQDMVILRAGANNPICQKFQDFILSPTATQIILSHGYGVGEN